MNATVKHALVATIPAAAGLAIGLSMVLGGVAFGQPGSGRLPDPPAPKVESTSDRPENFSAFLEAYERSGSPRLLVTGDIVGIGGTPCKALHDDALLSTLGSRLEGYFQDPAITLVNASAADLVSAVAQNELARNDERAAAKMVGQKVKADVVVYVRLLEQHHASAPYRASYEIVDLRRGTTIGTHSWDMAPDPQYRGEFTTYRLADYAKAIARRVAGDYAKMNPVSGAAEGRRFSITLVGDYADDDLASFRDAMRSVAGVREGSVRLREEDKGYGRAMAEFDLAYAGDLIDLRLDTRHAVVDAMAMQAEILGSSEGKLSLRLDPLSLSDQERLLVGGPMTGRNRAAREVLSSAYAGAGSPSIAFVVSQAMVEKEESLVDPSAPTGSATALQSGDGVNIVIGERVGLGGSLGLLGGDPFLERVIDRELSDRRTERKQDAVIDTMAFENRLVERFVQLGLTPRDVSAAQSSLEKAGSLAGHTWTDRTLGFELAKEAKADVVVSGVGRLVRDRSTGEPVRVVYTLRAYRVASGDVLAAATVERKITGLDDANRSIDEMAAEATGKLTTQLSARWAANPVQGETAEVPANP